MSYRVGIDIGGTKINIGILNSGKELLAHKKIFVKDITDLTADVKSVIDVLCEKVGITFDAIDALGIGVPGTVSEDRKKLIKAPNIDILHENIVEEFEEKLHIPTSLIQDSRAAAYAEAICGAGKNMNALICVTLGTGIGTGIVIDGKIYNGALNGAGEIGHICVEENGRPCGCGKKGCLEKYCAGVGLDITAKEILGDGKTAEDLFREAKGGNEKAKEAVNRAVVFLGRAIVSVVNLLSPSCILFSGGMSEQEEMYVNPLISYVQFHCYSSGKLPIIRKAALGENAPMIGAALIAETKKRETALSASVMCADVLNFGKALEEIKQAGIGYIHCDIMDNHFVPNLMLPPELLNELHDYTDMPFDYHLMAENPQSIIKALSLKEGDMVSVHAESTPHLQLVLSDIRKKGAKAAVAINPSTPIEVLTEVLPEIDMVLLMTVNPGFAGQKIVPGAFEKITRLRNMLDEQGYSHIKIEVDGNCSFENVPKMKAAGAEIFVVGTSSVFKKGMTIQEGTEKLLSLMK